ncbi:hypothetical protein AB0L04_00460 [Streptomyces glaucescens]|uniref:hypothetical protein n=1 Tax=Streptomyces glaucescens TaxID=1907 RepID=UPI00344CA15F
MIIVYTPADGEPEHYDASSLRVSEAAIVQRTIDMKWADIQQGLERDDLDAMRGIIWVIKKRSHPSLRFGDFDPGVTEMTTRMDKREVAAYVDNAFAAVDAELSVDTVADILMQRLPDIAADPDHARALIEARVKDDPKEAEAPAATQPQETPTDPVSNPSPTSSTPAPSTSASSPTSFTSPLELSTS